MNANDPSPEVPPGWYPDPTQVDTQRYWTGTTWTDQRAPLAPKPIPAKPSWVLSITARLALGILGAVAGFIAVFLPHVESTDVFIVTNNTLISSADGVIIVILALTAAAAAIRDASKPRLSWSLVLLGLILIGAAFLEGSGDQINVVNGLGQEVDSTVGPAVYVLGLGGGLILMSGLATSPRTRER